MKKIAALSITTALLSGVGFCAPATVKKPPLPQQKMQSSASTQGLKGIINVNATYESDYQPSTAKITFYVETNNKVLETATNENKKVASKAIEAVKKILNEDEGDTVKTLAFNVFPEYSYQKDNKKVFETYRVSNSFEVKTKSPKGIGKIIDTALSSGATRVEGLKYSLEADDEICNELIAQATKIAQKRAQSVAASMSAKLGGVKEISTSCSAVNEPNFMPVRPYAGAKTMDMAGGEIPAETGVIKVRAIVDGQFWLN